MIYETRHGLAADVRRQVIRILQAALTDALDVRLAVKQAHWNVKGEQFIALHELFDSFVTPLDDEIDTIAERIATLGGAPDGIAQSVVAGTTLSAYPKDITDGGAHLAALAERFAALGNRLRDAIDQSADLGDADTADLFTAASRLLDKSLWLLEAHLQGPSG
ncbi:DNA starvation/stationary phase protection protein Dps [Exilibacterium tricleocarpae]|uniref:DNA starvation/stationary phase protection protein Dps n=1 Tax=Exilibacterium tricleocarpae TaxID=2591008 RepID=A0A545UBF1_9GAMM|nr:DNA starvation/stationary phase protection protein Dps [Exilibacterium tricleocarpae]TQV86790.1 DNA starvation/stationary phase protection protein Dps [Exilibacterium tricleocarpae]